MKNRGLWIAVVAGFLLSGTIGCANRPGHNPAATPSSQAQASPQPSLEAAGAAQQVAELDAGVGADVVTRKVQSYSREMEAVLSRRGTPADPVASQVRWADPDDFRLGDLSRDPSAAMRESHDALPSGEGAQPAIQTSPSEANQVALSVSGGAPAPVQAIAAAANVPARADDPATRPVYHTASSAADLSQKLSARVRDYPRDVSGHLEYQLLQMLLDEQVPQLSALAGLSTEDRELITAVLDGLSLFRGTLRADGNTLLSRKIRPLLDMSDRLRSQAELSIPHVGLCRSVKGFGEYEPIEPARFTAMAEHKAILYCEVANFSTKLNDRQQWETELRQELVLYSESGMPVWSDRTETIRDTARTRRHDFFVNKRVVIPKNLSIGRYLLKVTIVDVHANRVAEASVPIVIAAQ